MAKIETFVFNHIEENTYVVYDETHCCLVIDPGMETPAENDIMAEFLSKQNLKITAILLTHTHIDHMAGLRWIYDNSKVPVFFHADAGKIFRQSEIYASVLGFNVGELNDIPVKNIIDKEIIPFGNGEIEARFVPGHAAGSMVYCLHSEKAVFTGDALFCGSIGRTDLPTGNYDLLIEKLRSQVLTLPDDYRIFPGHGPQSTIGDEKLYNSFLK